MGALDVGIMNFAKNESNNIHPLRKISVRKSFQKCILRTWNCVYIEEKKRKKEKTKQENEGKKNESKENNKLNKRKTIFVL